MIAMYLLNVYDAKEYGEVKRNQSTFDIENQLNVFLQINKLSCTLNVSLMLTSRNAYNTRRNSEVTIIFFSLPFIMEELCFEQFL